MIDITKCTNCGFVTEDNVVRLCIVCKTDRYKVSIQIEDDALVLTAHNIVSDEVVETQLGINYDEAIVSIAEHINRVNEHSGYSLAEWRIYEGRGSTLSAKTPANLYIIDELLEYITKEDK